MSAIRSLGAAWWACKGALVVGREPGVWTPLAVLASARLSVLVFLVFFHRPHIVAVGRPVVEWLGGAEALRYPDHLSMLPSMFVVVDRVVVVLLGAFLIAHAARVFARAFLPGIGPMTEGTGLRTAFHLAVVLTIWIAIDLAAAGLWGLLPEGIQQRGGKLGLILAGLQSLLFAGLRLPFLYALAAVAVLGDSAWRGVARSWRIAGTEPMGTFALVVFLAAARLPFAAVLGPVGAPRLADAPEIVVVALAVKVLVELVVLLVVVGATTRIVLWKSGGRG